jgi:hypothetical protein
MVMKNIDTSEKRDWSGRFTKRDFIDIRNRGSIIDNLPLHPGNSILSFLVDTRQISCGLDYAEHGMPLQYGNRKMI